MPSPPSVLRPKPVKPSRTPPHDVTDSPVLRPNRSNHRCRRVSDLPPSLDAFESFAHARRTDRLLDSPSSSPTRPTSLHPSSCFLVDPCTIWATRDIARHLWGSSAQVYSRSSLNLSLGLHLTLLTATSHPAAALHNQASTHNGCQSLITPRVTTTSTHVGRWSSGGAALAGAPQAGQIWLVLLGEGGCTSTASPVPWTASVGAEQYHYWKGCSLAVCGEASGSGGGSCMQRWQWLTAGVWGETPAVSWALASKHPIWPRRRWGSIAGDIYSSRAAT